MIDKVMIEARISSVALQNRQETKSKRGIRRSVGVVPAVPFAGSSENICRTVTSVERCHSHIGPGKGAFVMGAAVRCIHGLIFLWSDFCELKNAQAPDLPCSGPDGIAELVSLSLCSWGRQFR